MDLGLKNRIALVAASSRGLGKAIAFQLAREGAKVIVCARNKERLFKTRDELEAKTGSQVRAFVADVRNSIQVKDMVKQVVDEFKTVEILVCNAGGPPSGMVDDLTIDDYREALELNLLSTINLCYAILPLMKKQKWGRIITMTSVSAKQPIDNLILSNTARAGVIGFTKSLSNQVAPYGITVNSVCPGYTRTERVEELANVFQQSGQGTLVDFYHQIERTIPMGRLGQPEEIAQAVAFLVSEKASYITGVSLQVDGGYVKGIF